MGAGGDLDVKALLQRLQPAQRHAEARIGLAGRDRLQQLIGRAAVVDQFDVEIVLLEEAVIDRDRQRREADRAGIPRQFQFARRARQRRRVGRGLADREFREVDGGRCGAERKRLRAEHAGGRRQRRGGAAAQQGAAVQQRRVRRASGSSRRHVLAPSLGKAPPLAQSARLCGPKTRGRDGWVRFRSRRLRAVELGCANDAARCSNRQ